MSKLNWITDKVLDAAIAKFRLAADNAVKKAEQRQQRNVIDPFFSLLIASTLELDEAKDLVQWQATNSALNGMANALGHFHQEVLSGVEGWVNHDAGYDLECKDRQILAEVKNKHNTMNASTKDKAVNDLDAFIRNKGRGWTGYLVIVVPKKPERYKTHVASSRSLYEIDGASFYDDVTGHPNALHDLFDVLCNELTTSDNIAAYCQQIMKNSIPARIP